MKKKKSAFPLFLFFSLLLLAACGKKEDPMPSEPDAEITESIKPGDDRNPEMPTDPSPTEIPPADDGHQEAEEVLAAMEEGWWEEEYTFGYDCNRSDNHGCDFDGTMLYTMRIGLEAVLAYAINLDTGDFYPLCSKPNCLHNTEDCNAYVNDMGYVCFCGDKLIVASKGKAYSLRLDGTGSDELGSIRGETGLGQSSATMPLIHHRGYIYVGFSFYKAKEGVIRFVRMPVSGGDVEVLWEKVFSFENGKVPTEEDLQFLNYFGIGDCVYFGANFNGQGHLYRYHTVTGEISLVYKTDARIGMMAPENGKWYFMSIGLGQDRIHSWDPLTGEERLLYTYPGSCLDDARFLRFYEGGFFLPDEDDKDLLVFYDGEGTVRAKIPFPEVASNTIRGNEGHWGKYLVYMYRTREGTGYAYDYAVLDTSRLEDPSLEWTLIEISKESLLE